MTLDWSSSSLRQLFRFEERLDFRNSARWFPKAGFLANECDIKCVKVELVTVRRKRENTFLKHTHARIHKQSSSYLHVLWPYQRQTVTELSLSPSLFWQTTHCCSNITGVMRWSVFFFFFSSSMWLCFVHLNQPYHDRFVLILKDSSPKINILYLFNIMLFQTCMSFFFYRT